MGDLTASKLAMLADAAEMRAEELTNYPNGDNRPDRVTAQSIRIAAADARAVAESCNGFETPETLTFRMVLDNDRVMAETVRERARTIRERSKELRDALAQEDADWRNALAQRVPSAEEYAERAETPRKLTISYLADDLLGYFREDVRERMVETARTRTIYGNDPHVADEHRRRMAGVDIVSAMAAHALNGVDWLSVAREYLDRAEGRGEWAGA